MFRPTPKEYIVADAEVQNSQPAPDLLDDSDDEQIFSTEMPVVATHRQG